MINFLEDEWKCQVFTHYGMTETCYGMGVQCKAGLGYHLRHDLLVEIVDSKTGLQVLPGQCGEIVITTLFREAMPLIRYRTGDIANMMAKPCVCGGVLPQLGKVMGRKVNMLSLKNGRQLSIHQLDEILFGIPMIKTYQAKLIESGEEEILYLTVDAGEGLNIEDLYIYIKTKLLYDIKLQIEYAPLSPYSGSGKRSIFLDKTKESR